MAGFQLSVCAEMVFLDLPFIERVHRIHERGFSVEIWHWDNKDVKALAKSGAHFTSMTGYLSGNLTDDSEIKALLKSAELSLKIADQLHCRNLNLHGTGLNREGLPVKAVSEVTGAMWIKAEHTLNQLAALAERSGHVFTLENLNTAVDHPGVPFAKAADTFSLVTAINRAGLKMNLDLYHAQIGEGNLIALIQEAYDAQAIGEIQVADVPHRQEPGTGEINYAAIAQTLKKLNYEGVIGMEAWSSEDSLLALNRFSDVFAEPKEKIEFNKKELLI